MPRPFASGSRQAPDPYDQYLEQSGFYRKHTARDSSCLYRTISEQMYDTQMHHLEVRKICVDYMRKHKHFFQKGIDRDIDEYLDEMSKPKTYGTLTELRAVAYIYRRNVILFEAYNTGTYMTRERDFKGVFRIFFTPEKHFDSVFTSDFIETAAFCQGICYEILYKHVFKLPDVMYAVEEMLHGNSLEFVKSKVHYAGPYAKKIVYTDSRSFDFNSPEETNCILDNRVLCHFHNPNFPQFADTLHQDMHLIEVAQYDNQKITKTLDSLLPEKYISCVRQLLKDGITPFPYKVAKALDPDIYRNIEFDAWSEERKELRLKNWYMGGSNLQIGVKCLVRLGSPQNNIFNCHIQEMPHEKGGLCLVYIEELAEKYTVPYESLQPLPSDLAKPWPLPYRYQKNLQKNIVDSKKCRKINITGKGRYREIFSSIKKEIYTEDEMSSGKDDVSYQLKSFTSIEHYCPPSYEVLAMPFNVEHGNSNETIRNSRRNSANSTISQLTGATDVKTEPKEDDHNLDFSSADNFTPYGYDGLPESYYPYPYEGGVVHPGTHNPFYCMYNGQPTGPVVPHGVYIQPTVSCAQSVSNPYYPSHTGTVPPSVPIFSAPSAVPHNTMSNANVCRQYSGTLPPGHGRVNFAVNRSVLPSGDDLPHDIPTLQYFYNLGCEYYKQNQKKAAEANKNNDKNDPVHKLSNDLQINLKLEKESSGGNLQKSDHISSNPGSIHHNGKKYSSRCFNSKRTDKPVYRNNNNGGGNSDRFSHTDMQGKPMNIGKRTNYPVSVSAMNSSGQSNKVVMSSISSMKNCSEQAIQTSPTSTSVTTETWTNDLINNNMPIYNAQAGPMPFNGQCIPVYPEGDAQGVYVPTPTIMTVPYGMYPIPQAPHPTQTFQTYVPPPPNAPSMIPAPQPSFTTNPFTSPGGGNENTPFVLNADPVDNNPFTFMGYPPMYFPTNGGGMTSNGAPVQTGYWYSVTPPFPSSMTPTQAANNSTTSTSSAISIPSR